MTPYLHATVSPSCSRLPAPTCRQNPADYMLEVSSPNAEAEQGVNFAQLYTVSQLCAANARHVQASTAPAPGAEDLDLEQLAPASMLTQVGHQGSAAGGSEVFLRNKTWGMR